MAWSRLEPLPATPELEPGLQAQLADPLWMLARQWQMGELGGEDAGSPVEVRLTGETAPLGRYLAGRLGPGAAQRAVDYASVNVPLEPAVEAEPSLRSGIRLRAAGGLHFLRLLDAAGLSALRQRYADHYRLGVGPLDERGETLRRFLDGRAPDGERLAADLDPLADANGELSALPPTPRIPPEEGDAVRAVAGRWISWWRSLSFEPERPLAWDPARLEYGLAVQAGLGATRVVLEAGEYAGSRFDWYSFDLVPGASLGAPSTPPRVEEVSAVTLPSAASYPGMPADRLWEIEDARVFLGRVDAGPTDLARILLVEFALAFGNDWYVTPVDLPAGSVFRLTRLVVRDTFGVETEIPASRDLAGQRWTMFSSAPPDSPAPLHDVFFLPPVLASTVEGDPIEEVVLFRDEMANMAWGVERVVAGPSGERVDRAQVRGGAPLRQEVPGDLGDAQMVYRLMTPVPDYWFPLVPVPARGAPRGSEAAELERRSILRFRADGSSDLAQPNGLLLRANLSVAPEDDVFRIAEEEVPRSGIVVRRIPQLARTADGRTVLWVGRDKRTGRGEGSSAMRFDIAHPPA
jgi:hypothetical protein